MGTSSMTFQNENFAGSQGLRKERVVGKKRFTELVGDLLIKPQGRPQLALESDKRPEYIGPSSNPEEDFSKS